MEVDMKSLGRVGNLNLLTKGQLIKYQRDSNTVGNFEDGLKAAKLLSNKFPDCLVSRYNRGWFFLRDGDLFKGLTLQESGRLIGIRPSNNIGSIMPRWEGQKLKGKTVLVNLEGGLGDNITDVRFVNDIFKMGGKSVVVSIPELSPLFSKMEHVGAVCQKEAALGFYHNYWTYARDIAIVLKHGYEDISGEPYIRVDTEYIDKWSSLLKSNKLKVGIRWKGGDLFDVDDERIFPPRLMFDLGKVEGVQLYSLQRDSGVESLPKKSDIIDLAAMLQTLEDTAGIIENLDLVITSCTSIAHLSGAMGKETWVITPILPHVTWAVPGERTSWYDSVRVFRQEKYREWEGTFEKIRKCLVERVCVN